MAQRRKWKANTVHQDRTLLGGQFTIGAAGAITDASSDSAAITGGTVTQTDSEDGRYLVTLHSSYTRVRAFVQMVGPDDSAFPTTTGSDPQIRDQNTGDFSIQFKRTDTQADADPASGTVVNWLAICDN